MKPQKIYIIEFYPQHGDLMRQGQTINPIKDLQDCAHQYKDGIRGATIRPLMLHGRQVYSLNGKRVTELVAPMVSS